MRILLCIKEVPETDAPIVLDQTSRWIDENNQHCYRMNRFDEFAVEEAVLIKEKIPNTILDALTVGPKRADKILRRALGMGVDNATHIQSERCGYLSPFITASWIAKYALDKNYDLILTGVISEDNMQGQTGPIIAELLSIPCATSVIFERISCEEDRIYVEREIESGSRHCIEITLPALLTIQSGINKPRYPSLSKMLRARKFEIPIICSESLLDVESREELEVVQYPSKSRQGLILEGTLSQKASELAGILDKKSLIR